MPEDFGRYSGKNGIIGSEMSIPLVTSLKRICVLNPFVEVSFKNQSDSDNTIYDHRLVVNDELEE